jgi:hypothetical protein
MTTSFAYGCLELRLRIATSRDLQDLRRLVEGGSLRAGVERALLTEQRRQWLKQKAALFGMKWRDLKFKVTIKDADLDRCEVFLKSMEGEIVIIIVIAIVNVPIVVVIISFINIIVVIVIIVVVVIILVLLFCYHHHHRCCHHRRCSHQHYHRHFSHQHCHPLSLVLSSLSSSLS